MENNQVVDYYNTIANDYDNSRFNNSYGQFIDAEERRILDRLIDTEAPTRRLEMACGTGRLTNYATHGLDASSEMMAHAQERHPEVLFREASACATGFADAEFDVVYTFHLLMHLDEATILQIFDEACRILKPGGRFILDIPSKKRRHLLGKKRDNWHGSTSLTTDEVLALAAGKFDLRSTHGIMMLPVHKLPVGLRRSMLKLDFAMANGAMKDYSSYLVYELVKK